MAFVKKNLLYIVLGLIVVITGYYFLVVKGNSNNDATITATAGPASEAEATFISLSAQLEPITFDTKVLSDPRFVALQDIHTSIVPEAAGRKDPFASLPGVFSAAK